MTELHIQINAIGYDDKGKAIILKQFSDKTGWTIQTPEQIRPFKTLIQAIAYAKKICNI